MAMPIPGDAAPMTKISQSWGKKTPKKSGFWCCHRHWDIRWERSGCDRGRRGESSSPQILAAGWGLEPEHQHNNPVFPPTQVGSHGIPGGSSRGGEGLQSQEPVAAPIKSTHNAFWIKERDCFHLSSYKNNPWGQTEGEEAQAEFSAG